MSLEQNNRTESVVDREPELPVSSVETREKVSHLSVEETMKKSNAYFVHMFQVADTLDVSENNKAIDTKKLSAEDRMDILYSVSPTLSASTLRPETSDETFKGGFGIILGKGEIQSASPTDDGTIASSFEHRHVIGGNKNSEEDITRAVDRSKNTGGYNEIVIKNPSVCGSFMKLGDDERVVYEEKSVDYGNFGGTKTRKEGVLDMSNIMFGKRVEASYDLPFNTLLAMKNRGQGGQMFLLNSKNEMLLITDIDEEKRQVKFDAVPVMPEDMAIHFSDKGINKYTKQEMSDRLKAKGLIV